MYSAAATSFQVFVCPAGTHSPLTGGRPALGPEGLASPMVTTAHLSVEFAKLTSTICRSCARATGGASAKCQGPRMQRRQRHGLASFPPSLIAPLVTPRDEDR